MNVIAQTEAAKRDFAVVGYVAVGEVVHAVLFDHMTQRIEHVPVSMLRNVRAR